MRANQQFDIDKFKAQIKAPNIYYFIGSYFPNSLQMYFSLEITKADSNNGNVISKFYNFLNLLCGDKTINMKIFED